MQSLKMARGLKFCIYEAEELYYLCSENKCADQLRGYREADLRLCFRICKNVFLMTRLNWCGRTGTPEHAYKHLVFVESLDNKYHPTVLHGTSLFACLPRV